MQKIFTFPSLQFSFILQETSTILLKKSETLVSTKYLIKLNVSLMSSSAITFFFVPVVKTTILLSCQKMSSLIHLTSKFKKIINAEQACLIYTSIVQPMFEYSSRGFHIKTHCILRGPIIGQ